MRKNGKRFQARLPPEADPDNKGFRLVHPDGPFDTAAAAWEALRRSDAERTLAVGSSTQRASREARERRTGAPRRTVNLVCREYIMFRRDDPDAPLSARTIDGYKSVLRDQINDPDEGIGAIIAANLTTTDVEDWLRRLASTSKTHESGKWHGRPLHSSASRDRAKALLSAALNWEKRAERLPANPVENLHTYSSKHSRAKKKARDDIFIPTWEQSAHLVAAVPRSDDKLLMMLLGWTGLRWAEAISLSCEAVNPNAPAVYVADVWVRRDRKPTDPIPTPYRRKDGSLSQPSRKVWDKEPVKTGQKGWVPVPRRLWEELQRVAATRGDQRFLFPNSNFRSGVGRIPIIQQGNWHEDVWVPARDAVGIGPDSKAPPGTPERVGMVVKDLRAYAASVIVDSGGTATDAQALLRHTDPRTTQTHYSRAMAIKQFDPDRASLRTDSGMSLSERMDQLFELWFSRYNQLLASAFLDVEVASPQPRKVSAKVMPAHRVSPRS